MREVRGWTAAAPALAALALGGCAMLEGRRVERADPPPVVNVLPPPIVEVEPPTDARGQARSCVPRTLGPAPRYPDTDSALRAAAGAADRYQLMAAGRILRQKRLEELERVVAGCR